MITTINEFKAASYIKNLINKEQYILRKKSSDDLQHVYLEFSANYGRSFHHIAGYPVSKAEKEFEKIISDNNLDTLDGLKTYATNKLQSDKEHKKSAKQKTLGIKVPLQENNNESTNPEEVIIRGIFKEVVTAIKGVSSNIKPIKEYASFDKYWNRIVYILSEQSGNWGRNAQDNYKWDEEEYDDGWGWVVGSYYEQEGMDGYDLWKSDEAIIAEIRKKYPEYEIEMEGLKDVLSLEISKKRQR